ncbi:MAG: prenyltransferase/squalene oxidase repeat-containing protein [Eubacteriales bacterium]
MEGTALSGMLEKAKGFVWEGCRSIMEDGPLTPERFLISPCPVSTALAVLALMTSPVKYAAGIRNGLQYLETDRNPDGGWGRTPRSPSDEKSTQICETAITCGQTGLNPEAIQTAASNISATWMQDVPRLVLNWPADSPLMKILEYFILGETASNIFGDISFEHLPVVLALLPPAGRPLITALSCIREAARKKKVRTLNSIVKKLVTFQFPNGAWGEDVMITAISILCLSIVGRHQAALTRGTKWLAHIQYLSGAWPSFNRLTNWDVGLTAFVIRNDLDENPRLIDECFRFLSARANQDGSFGTLFPYTFPDLDDTAAAFLGLSALPGSSEQNRDLLSRTSQLLLNSQNLDGSWGTFPEVTGIPPGCTCHHPIHIKSVDVTIHVMQSLLKSGTDIKSLHLQKALWWLAYQQKWDGSWKSTWYIGNTYATSQALELLAECFIWPNARLKARNWLLAAQKDNGSWPIGSSGECGLALTALLKNSEDPTSPAIRKGLAYMCSLQQPDGSFAPAYGSLYASGLYYEDPITECLAVIRAIKVYQIAASLPNR